MHIERRILSASDHWQIEQIDVSDASYEPGPEQVLDTNVLVLPVAGVFAKHASRHNRTLGTPNDAVIICSNQPYRLSYPNGIGDRCLTVRFADAMLPEFVSGPVTRSQKLRDSIPLTARWILIRNLLWHRLQVGHTDKTELDEVASAFIADVLASVMDVEQSNGQQHVRHNSQVEAVKEAITCNPSHGWTLSELGRVANVSRFHLSKTFRRTTGTSVYSYVLRARLAKALALLVDTELNLTAIAFECGFSSHSHFTARFRAFFGLTPVMVRSAASAQSISQMRTMLTAPSS